MTGASGWVGVEAAGQFVAMPSGERERLVGEGRRYYAERLSFSLGVESVLRLYGVMMAGATACSR